MLRHALVMQISSFQIIHDAPCNNGKQASSLRVNEDGVEGKDNGRMFQRREVHFAFFAGREKVRRKLKHRPIG